MMMTKSVFVSKRKFKYECFRFPRWDYISLKGGLATPPYINFSVSGDKYLRFSFFT